MLSNQNFVRISCIHLYLPPSFQLNLFELSSFTNTSYCETKHRLTSSPLCFVHLVRLDLIILIIYGEAPHYNLTQHRLKCNSIIQ
jgi:hypothetical protein